MLITLEIVNVTRSIWGAVFDVVKKGFSLLVQQTKLRGWDDKITPHATNYKTAMVKKCNVWRKKKNDGIIAATDWIPTGCKGRLEMRLLGEINEDPEKTKDIDISPYLYPFDNFSNNIILCLGFFKKIFCLKIVFFPLERT